ncbi:sugar fermentation stimulation protein [Aphanomyces invadans]|uniref:Sugar fermentation stimulation protein n=1 Tax=Aphanomyces invadans TaxID=157072 RepID=A0A024UV25_9STRA|nr:sugar fermentation stimulation protein [Aphanomyces invadans]ETW09782.1 sugar fermentation stimulation protein [Aphanomyces invadans]|eukprot:XP_008861193.1 sugar fermentation stimulation protein [Aphanomyces invadans]
MAAVHTFQRWAFRTMAAAPQRQLRSRSISSKRKDVPVSDAPLSPVVRIKKPRNVKNAKTATPQDVPLSSTKRKVSPVGFIAMTPVSGDRIVYEFPTLVSGKLIKRYKRFLADVQLDNSDTVVTVHCPNTGPMIGLLDLPLAPVRLSVSDNAKRKYAHTLEYIQVVNDANEATWVGVHSASANRMVETALRNGWLPEVVGHRQIMSIQAEVKHTKDSRVDFVVTTDDGVDTFVEVKSVTLANASEPTADVMPQQRCAVFPDTVSTRASKHVQELVHLIQNNQRRRAAIVFLVQRGDCTAFAPSEVHDPAFAAHCEEAKAAGVVIHAYACALDSSKPRVMLLGPLPPQAKA